MKKGNLSKLVIILFLSMLVLVGCNQGSNQVNNSSDKNVYKIGISQLAEHSALDDARKGFEDGLKELGIKAEITVQNAQGELPNTISISQKFVKDKVDLIYAIATTSAQSAKQATKDIPIIFSAVTDPVEAQLVNSMESPGGNITGTSDASPMDKQLQLFKDLDNNIEKIGIIYNTGEDNSPVQIRMAEEIGESLGLEIITVGISTINDMPQAVDSLIKRVDGIYTIADNMVASGINIIAQKAISNNMITVAAEDAHVQNGILITDGLSYYELGKQSAEMAKKILIDGKSPGEIAAETSTNTKKVFNKATLKALNIDENNKAFKDATGIE